MAKYSDYSDKVTKVGRAIPHVAQPSDYNDGGKLKKGKNVPQVAHSSDYSDGEIPLTAKNEEEIPKTRKADKKIPAIVKNDEAFSETTNSNGDITPSIIMMERFQRIKRVIKRLQLHRFQQYQIVK